MLTEDQKKRVDEAIEARQFKDSPAYRTLRAMLDEYRADAVAEISEALTDFDGPVRRLHAVNGLIEHIEAALESRLTQMRDVAEELNINMTELRMRSEIEDGE